MRRDRHHDVESLSGDVARARRREEHNHRRDVLGLVGAAQRNAVRAAPFDLLDARALRFGDFTRPAKAAALPMPWPAVTIAT